MIDSINLGPVVLVALFLLVPLGGAMVCSAIAELIITKMENKENQNGKD